MTDTINNSVSVNGLGLYPANTRQSRFLKSSLSYRPDIDPRVPKHVLLAGNLQQTDTVVKLTSVDDVPTPEPGQTGSLRVGAEVVRYSNVITGNSSVVIAQRSVANTGAIYSGNVAAGNLVSILGLSPVPAGQQVRVYNGNLLFTATSLGLGYVSGEANVTISAPELRNGTVARVKVVYLYANGAVEAITIANAGLGYISNPTITVTGSNTTPFVGTAVLAAL